MSYLEALVSRLGAPRDVGPLVRPADAIVAGPPPPGLEDEVDVVDAAPPRVAPPPTVGDDRPPAPPSEPPTDIAPRPPSPSGAATPMPRTGRPSTPREAFDRSDPRAAQAPEPPDASDRPPSVERVERVERIETRHHVTHEVLRERSIEIRPAPSEPVPPVIEPVARGPAALGPPPSPVAPADRPTRDVAPRPAAAIPTVNITIGRVVVRAEEQPSALPSSKPAPVQHLSLAEYLSERNRS